MNEPEFMRDRQRPLTRLYRQEPRAAQVTDRAHTVSDLTDPLHGELVLGHDQPLRFALHTAVGGESDFAVPGDILCGALASCFDSTLRVIADRMRIELTRVEVVVQGHIDVRGTLCVSTEVPVGFSRFTVSVAVRAANAQPQQLETLMQMTEHCCVVFQTMRKGVQIDVRVADLEGETDAA